MFECFELPASQRRKPYQNSAANMVRATARCRHRISCGGVFAIAITAWGQSPTRELKSASRLPGGQTLQFSTVFGDGMVLQRAPAQAAVYGVVNETAAMALAVTVTVAAAGRTYSVAATVTGQ